MAQNNFANMHADAVRRAREMYSRSRSFEAKPQNERAEKLTEEKNMQNKPLQPQKQKDIRNKDLFEILLKDPDKTIILALMIILSSEKTDSSLLFALIYLLI